MAADELPLLRDYFWLLWVRKASVLAVVAVFLGLGLVEFASQPRLYVTSEEVLIRPIGRKFPSIDIHEFQQIESERRLAESASVRQLVAARLGGPPKASVKVEAPENTGTLLFVATSKDPVTAQATATASAKVFLAFRLHRLQDDFNVAASAVKRMEEEVVRRIDQAVSEGRASDVESLSAQRTSLAMRFVDLSLAIPDGIEVGRVLRSAPVPRAPSSPRLPKTLSTALLIGTFVGVAQVLVRARVVPRLQGRTDLARGMQAPVYALVPVKRRGRRELVTSPARAASAYEALRDAVLAGHRHEGIRVVVVTSPGPGEGKSRTVANLGVALAQSGCRVILVAADPRHSSLRSYFGGDEGGAGLFGVLAGERSLGGVLCQTFVAGLSVLHSGVAADDTKTNGLLASDAMRRLLDELASEADLVLIDAPPALTTADTLDLAVLSDAVLVVAAADRTTLAALHETRFRLDRIGVDVIGAVLNGVDGVRVRFENHHDRQEWRYAPSWESRLNDHDPAATS
jgi:capsular exopolysaccharide synthesis family protein